VFDRTLYWWQQIARRWFAGGLVLVLLMATTACSQGAEPETNSRNGTSTSAVAKPQLVEVSPPETLQKLNSKLDVYRPQVTITAPSPDEVIEDTTVEVNLQVKDLPLYRDANFNLGPHLRVFLDNRAAVSVYDTSQPIQFSDLSPGSHTIQVLAAKPWEESFKNEGAYARTTFHVFTKTSQDIPDPEQPLLTYNTPQGTQGAEPILLDFYLDNAPLHLAAQQDPNDEIEDWQIRITANGETFYFDRWQPVYLKGFSAGQNWIQLEYINERGEIVANPIDNNTKQITYEPNAQDSLSQLIRGEIPLEEALAIVDPNYTKPSEPEVEETPQPEETAEPQPEETAEPQPEETAEPQPEETAEPQPEETAEPQPEETAEPQPEETAEPQTEETAEPQTEETAEPQTEETAEPQPEETAEPQTEETAEPQPEEIPQPEETFEPELEENFEPELEEIPQPEEIPEPELEETPELETQVNQTKEATQPETDAESSVESSESEADKKRDRQQPESSESESEADKSARAEEDSEAKNSRSVSESESEAAQSQKQPEQTSPNQSK
jgi:hypothetical protein